jgi:hypothetical protein
MSKIALTPNASGTGTFTIASPGTNTDRTLTLPDATGTVNVSGLANEVPAGSAGAPAIYPTGDNNTGIFFPAADTIAFAEGGVERLRIADAGQIGIGGANYGTSGQVLTSGGSGAAPSWTAASSHTLLGTVATTSGSSATLSGLDLTPYKFLMIHHYEVSTTLTTSTIQFNGFMIGRGGDSNQDGFSIGGIIVDLGMNFFWGSWMYYRTSSAAGGPASTAGRSGMTTASTSVTLSTNTGTFDGGSFRVYGVR